MLSLGLCLLEDFLSLLTDFLTVCFDFLVGSFAGMSDFSLGNAFPLTQLLIKPLDHMLRAMDWQEWLDKVHIFFLKDVHIPSDILRIGGYYRTVEMI